MDVCVPRGRRLRALCGVPSIVSLPPRSNLHARCRCSASRVPRDAHPFLTMPSLDARLLSLGASISRVKSVVHDTWDASLARTLLTGGNDLARERYLFGLPATYKEPTPTTEDAKVAAYIRSKYLKLKWAEPMLRETLLAERATMRDAALQRKKAAGVPSVRSSKAKGGSRPMPSLCSESLR